MTREDMVNALLLLGFKRDSLRHDPVQRFTLTVSWQYMINARIYPDIVHVRHMVGPLGESWSTRVAETVEYKRASAPDHLARALAVRPEWLPIKSEADAIARQGAQS